MNTSKAKAKTKTETKERETIEVRSAEVSNVRVVEFKNGDVVFFTLCLIFNLYAEYIMRNAGLEEAQAGIKIAGRNINNLRCADDTTLMAESEEELKSLLMKVKEESEKLA